MIIETITMYKPSQARGTMCTLGTTLILEVISEGLKQPEAPRSKYTQYEV